MDDVTAQIDVMKARWMTGGSGEVACPEPWRDALGNAPNLTLVALAGQFARIATAPATEALTARSPLPKLGLPTVDEDIRPLVRRALDLKTTSPSSLLTLMAIRGVTVHPADWMPKASTDVPDIYGPWIDWISEDSSGFDEDELTEENWDTWMPHARKAALAEMRRTAPDAARELIAAKAADVPAEQRLRLIAILHDGLSDADAEVLEGFTADRSGKVKALANNFLARLGKSTADKEAVDEFVAFFEVQKAGMLSRKQVIVARKLKTNAQKARRFELANALPLAAFASAMDVTSDQLIDMIDLGDATPDLVAMTATTGTASQSLRLVDRIQAGKSDVDLTELVARLDGPHRIETAKALAKRDTAGFQSTLNALGPELGTLDASTLQGSQSMAVLEKHLRKEDGRVAASIDTTLTNLGLIASYDAAESLLTHLTTNLDLMAADPRLALLRLNASLPNTTKET